MEIFLSIFEINYSNFYVSNNLFYFRFIRYICENVEYLVDGKNVTISLDYSLRKIQYHERCFDGYIKFICNLLTLRKLIIINNIYLLNRNFRNWS
jgi:hypothetical protein